MHLALRQFEPTTIPRPEFFGHMFDIGEIMDLARSEGPKASALVKFLAPTPSQKHTFNSAKEFTSERVVKSAYGQLLSASWFEYFSKIEHVSPRVANSDSFVAEWVAQLHRADSKEISSITKTLSLLIDRLNVDGLDAIDADLDMIDVQKSHPYHLLAALRTLFNQRHFLPSWKLLERRTREEFEKQGLKPMRVMKGLDVDDKVQTAD